MEVSYQRGCFMVEKQQDAVVRSLVREHWEASRRRISLEAEAQRLSGVLEHLARVLKRSPQSVAFDGEGLSPEFSRERENFDSSSVDAGLIKGLCDDLRKTISDCERLSKQLKYLGV
jgi:hypothetical protein